MRGGEPLGATGADRHTGAGLGKGKGDRTPDTAAAAGDDRALASKIDLHASSWTFARRTACVAAAIEKRGAQSPPAILNSPAYSGIAGKNLILPLFKPRSVGLSV